MPHPTDWKLGHSPQHDRSLQYPPDIGAISATFTAQVMIVVVCVTGTDGTPAPTGPRVASSRTIVGTMFAGFSVGETAWRTWHHGDHLIPPAGSGAGSICQISSDRFSHTEQTTPTV